MPEATDYRLMILVGTSAVLLDVKYLSLDAQVRCRMYDGADRGRVEGRRPHFRRHLNG